MFFLFISDVNPTIYPQIYPSWHGPLIFPNIVIRDMCSLVCCVFFFIVPLKDARLTVIGFQILSIHRVVSAIWVLHKHYLYIFNFNETSIHAWQLMFGRNNELGSVLFVCLCLC